MIRWNEESTGGRFGRKSGFEWFHAKEIIFDAYLEGYIDWNVLQKALERTKTMANGSWMFKNHA